MAEPTTLADRLQALLDHLGIASAHVATQIPGDIAALATTAPERIRGLVLAVPTRLDPEPFVGLADRLLMIAGDSGITADTTARAAARLPGAKRHVLAGYEAAGWSDAVADRGDAMVAAMTAFLAAAPASAPASFAAPGPASGTTAGLTWRIDGRGPPLLLLPFFLAPSQWDPAISALARHFCVIRVGGPLIGGIAALEDRARAPTYRAMFHGLVDRLGLDPGARVLDVGCGSGALDRMLSARLPAGASIDALDLNPFFLREAEALATADGSGSRITFQQGSALALPFADALFDAVFSVTVLEECDADRAIAEMVRVARPGARIAIVVRAIDMAQWWGLELPASIRAKADVPPQSVGHGGVADKSLYPRLRKAGLVDVEPFPALITLDQPGGPIWRYREDHVLSLLSAGELEIWRQARRDAAHQGLLMGAHVLHCAVGRKPG